MRRAPTSQKLVKRAIVMMVMFIVGDQKSGHFTKPYVKGVNGS